MDTLCKSKLKENKVLAVRKGIGFLPPVEQAEEACTQTIIFKLQLSNHWRTASLTRNFKIKANPGIRSWLFIGRKTSIYSTIISSTNNQAGLPSPM